MGHVESFSLLQISLKLSAPRFASLLQSIDVQRLVGSKDGTICHITRPVFLCTAPGFYPAETCPGESFLGLARRKSPRDTGTALVTLMAQIPPALHVSLGAVRPRSRLRSWGRVAVTSKARLSLSSGDTYLNRLTERLDSLERCPHRQARGRDLSSTSVPFVTTLDSHMLARVCVHSPGPVFLFLYPPCLFLLCLVLVCIRWPPPCVLVELSSSQRFLSTGNDARQHIKMGHTLRAASLDLHLSNPSPSLPSNPMLFPSLFPAVVPFPGGNWTGFQGSPAPQSEFLQ